MRLPCFSFLAATVLLSGCSFLTTENPDPNHTHADFAVWIGGKQLNFSDEVYMSGSSKAEEEGEHPHTHLHPYLHLHDSNGNVAHRHKPGLTFGDFLTSLGFRLDPSSSVLCFDPADGARTCWHTTDTDDWRFFVNGKEAAACGPTEDCPHPFLVAWTYVFADEDAVLLTYKASDDEAEKELKQMTNDACLYSQTCPWRGKPPAESCIADPTVPCTQ
ncbi:hypothetical protein HZA45_02050 [Candidatus Peregrinibacteria bacterium]|nr:hypothetical protein [Candidatus Peregrinibacteria bacterium]